MLFGTIIGVIGLFATLYAIYATNKYSPEKKPRWSYCTEEIINTDSHNLTEIELYFNKKLVPNVFKTKVIFLNKSIAAIRKADVPDKIPFFFHGSEILSTPIIYKRSDSRILPFIEYKPQIDNNMFRLGFEYLNFNDGVLLEIYHTKYEKIDCDGNVVGSKRIKNIIEFPEYRVPSSHLAKGIILVILGIIGLSLLIFGLQNTFEFSSILSLIIWLFISSFSIVLGISGVFNIHEFIRNNQFPDWVFTEKEREENGDSDSENVKQ